MVREWREILCILGSLQIELSEPASECISGGQALVPSMQTEAVPLQFSGTTPQNSEGALHWTLCIVRKLCAGECTEWLQELITNILRFILSEYCNTKVC